jgi:hypothetical protein
MKGNFQKSLASVFTSCYKAIETNNGSKPESREYDIVDINNYRNHKKNGETVSNSLDHDEFQHLLFMHMYRPKLASRFLFSLHGPGKSLHNIPTDAFRLDP